MNIKSSGHYRALVAAIVLSAFSCPSVFAQTFVTVDESPAGTWFDPLHFDVLGIRPGDTIEEVTAKFSELFPGDKAPQEVRLEGNVAAPNGAQVPINFVSELRRGADSGLPPLYRNGKAGDWPTVYFASEVYDKRALAVARSLYFDQKEMMSADAMRLQIAEKYGKPTIIQREADGHTSSVVYLYSGGKLLGDTTYTIDRQSCAMVGKVEDCGSFTKEKAERGGQLVSLLKAKTPCAGMLEYSRSPGRPAEYKYMGSTLVEDEACEGILTVNFVGSSAKLDRVDFYLEDVKRAYGHKVALDSAINQALERNSSSGSAVKPRL